MSKKQNRVTFEELADHFSHYEIAMLSFLKASDVILSAKSLLSDGPYKPKVAVYAYDEICGDLQKTILYKEEVLRRFNPCSSVEEEDYEVEE